MTSKKDVNLAEGYDNTHDYQAEIDEIEMQLSHWGTVCQEAEAELAEWKSRARAAEELAAAAEKVLAGPARIGITSDARNDQFKARAVLKRAAEEIQAQEERLGTARAWLASFEEKKKAFPREKLRAQQRLQELRQRTGPLPRGAFARD